MTPARTLTFLVWLTMDGEGQNSEGASPFRANLIAAYSIMPLPRRRPIEYMTPDTLHTACRFERCTSLEAFLVTEAGKNLRNPTNQRHFAETETCDPRNPRRLLRSRDQFEVTVNGSFEVR